VLGAPAAGATQTKTADGARPQRAAKAPRRRRSPAKAASDAKPAPAAAASRRTPRRPGRKKGSGTRGAQALALVTKNPGITIPELASRMGIKQNYLYRVLPGLEQEGKIEKQGRAWHPKSA
jgi:hypothetical protein